MKFTNKFNLPSDVYKACAAEQYEPDPNRIGVTSLIAPAHIRQLTIKHWNEIEVDASSRLWAVLGEAVHLVMDKYNKPEGIMPVRKLEVKIDGMTIVGVTDNYDINETGNITDYKCTSVFSFMGGLKQDWEQQLNVYAWLAHKHGIKINNLRINAILRDWQVSKARYGVKFGDDGEIKGWGKPLQSDYPSIPFQSVDVPLWPIEKIEQFIRNRLTSHQKCGIICTDEERWQRPTVYAVMKKGNKKALACNNYVGGNKIPFTKDNATEWIAENQKKGENLYIEERPGSCVRCENYCIVKQFCSFGKTL